MSGPTVTTTGLLGRPNATSAAFAELGFGETLGGVVYAAVQRAVERWDGGEGATPLVAQEGEAPSEFEFGADGLAVEIDDQVAAADQRFAGFVVPPDVEELELTFVDDGLSGVIRFGGPLESGGRRLSSTDTETYVLIDAFVGDNTRRFVFIRKVTNGVAQVRVRLSGRVAVLVGAVLRTSAHGRSDAFHDRNWESRLSGQERAHPDIVASHPRIEQVPPTSAPIGVFVHGTLSTCVPALAELSVRSGIQLARFEHDTMRPIAESAADLVTELKRIGSPAVKLIGHSRGGLVVTLAAAQANCVDSVLTFGAPHCGTPLASAMDGLLSYATVALGAAAGSMVMGGLTAVIFGSNMPSDGLPDGWADMQPHCSFIRTLPLIDTSKVHAYGGEFDDSVGGLGTGPGFIPTMMTALMGTPNDLVVPTNSSSPQHLAKRTVLTQVDHFSYFRDPSAQNAIADALRDPSPPKPKKRSIRRPRRP